MTTISVNQQNNSDVGKQDLSVKDFQTIVYFAVGVSSESKLKAYSLEIAANQNKDGTLRPIANSGYSVGTIQTDLGQHPEAAKDLVNAYQKWAEIRQPDWKLSENQEKAIIHDLGRTGRDIRSEGGRPLNPEFRSRLNQFLASEDGITWVHMRDTKQINKIEQIIFNPLQQTELYKRLPIEEKTHLVAVTSKLYNQSETWGKRVLQEIQDGKHHTIRAVDNKIDMIIAAKDDYIETGRKEAVLGATLISRLDSLDPKNPLFDKWKEIKAEPLINPAGLEGVQKEAYNEIRKLFVDPEKSINMLKRQEGKEFNVSHSKQSEFSALINGLMNDKDGSFTQKILADNRDVIDDFDKRLQLKTYQDDKLAVQSPQQENQQEERSRSGRVVG